MSYFFRSNNFDLDKYDFDIEIIPRFTKKEQEILVLLLENYEVEDEYSRIKKKLIDLDNKELKKTIMNLMKKTVYCTIFMEKEKKSQLFFTIFDFIINENDELIYKFSREVESGNKLGNFYTRINLLGIFKFKHEHTKKIYKLIVKKTEKRGSIEYTLDQFKKILDIKEESYKRYFNLEAKVLKPLIKDIESAEVTLWFEKIKSNSTKTSRITGIRIHYVNGLISQIHKETNELMKMYSSHILDFARTYKLIYNYKKFNTIEDTIKYINDNFDYIFSEE